MNKQIIVLSLLTFSSSAFAYDFKGVEVGAPATPDIIQEKLGVRCGAGKRPAAYVCNGHTTIAGAPAFMNLVIGESGNVQRISMIFDTDHYHDVAAAMITKYGSPSDIQNSTLHNAMGATFNQTIVKWEEPGNSITLRKYASKITKSSIYFSTQEDIDFYEKIRQEKLSDL